MYLPIDALNHGYHYETLKVEIPHDDFVGEWEDNHAVWIDETAEEEWHDTLNRTIQDSLRVSFWYENYTDSAIGKYEMVIADSKLVQIRTTVYQANWVIVIVRETPHDYYHYIHNLSGIHVNRITAELKDRLTKLGYEVS